MTKKWLQSEKYRTTDGISFESELAKRFYKRYLINMEDTNLENAFFAVLHAAWACDDVQDDANAKHCREVAIPLVTMLIESERNNKDNLLLMRADLMRRAGQFKDLIDQYKSIEFEEKLLNQILKFEIDKAENGDMACYRVEDVERANSSETGSNTPNAEELIKSFRW